MERVCLRELTAEERASLEKLAHARTAPARVVERASMIWSASRGDTVVAIAAHWHRDAETVRKRIHRFNAEGLGALEDRARCGRPATYSTEQVAEVVATALSAPHSLGLPFASWTLDRLAAYLSEHKGIVMKRSRIDEILLQEGLRWRQQETWFGARVDPDFAEKRGRSRHSTRPRRTAALSSVSTKWGR